MGKLIRFIVLILALVPTAVLALPGAPAQTGNFTVSNATLDSVTSATSQPDYSNNGVLGYVLSFHDSTYEYALPICSGATMVEVNGQTINPNSFVAGDILTITAGQSTPPGTECIQNVVRQVISRGPTQGQCLQNYQVTHSVDGSPKTLQPNTPYTYIITVYARPTFDCDGQAYGSESITSQIATGQSFNVAVSQGSNQLSSWSITTGSKGTANFSYTFSQNGKYTFSVQPAADQTPGDVIYWTDTAGVASASTPSPSPAASTNRGVTLDTAPFVFFVIVVLLAIGALEYWHWRRKRKRSHELPVEEYMRTPKL